jgi:hypothetical protein
LYNNATSKYFIKKAYQSVKNYFFLIINNTFFQLSFVVILLVPLIATLGQYLHTGFILETTPVPLLFWPGVNGHVSPNIPVWFAMGIMMVSYAVSIGYLADKRNLGKVVMFGFIVAILSTGFTSIINSFTGWEDTQNVTNVITAGQANIAIFSLWHNPVWEEIVFRGIPLLILFVIQKNTNPKISFWAKVGYLVLPSILLAFYHLPNHGPARIADTFILGLFFSWTALRFSFFAPLILHYYFDNNMIANFGNILNIPEEEISWLVNNHALLNSISSIGMLFLAILIPMLAFWYLLKRRQQRLRSLQTGL